MSCKRGQLSLLKLPSAADIMKSPVVANSPGQRPGETKAAIDTIGIFAPTAQKCHAPKARNPLMPLTPHGALPLIMQAALFIMSAALGNPSKLDCPRLHDISERDTLINATLLPRALPGAGGNNWAYSPPQPFAHSAQAINLHGGRLQ